jgi:adenylylsulfate kinase
VSRAVLGAPPDSEVEREFVHRTLAYTAKLLTDAGVSVIVDATAPRRAWRDLARELIAHFAEIQLLCPPNLCIDRERAVRWDLGVRPFSGHSTAGGVSAPDIVLEYERSLRAELTIYTDVQAPWTAVEEVLTLARQLIYTTARTTTARAADDEGKRP